MKATIACLLLIAVKVGDFKECGFSDFVPGMERMAFGVDVTKLDLCHDYKLDFEAGLREQVIEFTCEKNNTANNALNHTIPDQVAEVADEEMDTAFTPILGIQPELYPHEKERNEPLQTLKQFVHSTITFEDKANQYGVCSSSSTFKKHQSVFCNTSKYEVGSRLQITSHDVFLDVKQSDTTKALLESFNQLPEKASAAPENFTNFITKYGTHYFKDGYFGGEVRVIFQFEKENREVDDDHASRVGRNIIEQLLSLGDYAEEPEKEFKGYALQYCGGERAPTDPSLTPTKWKESLRDTPSLIGGELRPLTELLPDGPRNLALQSMVQAYMSRAYLLELQRSLNGDEFVTLFLVNREEIVQQFLSKINRHMNKTFLEFREVKRIASDLYFYRDVVSEEKHVERCTKRTERDIKSLIKCYRDPSITKTSADEKNRMILIKCLKEVTKKDTVREAVHRFSEMSCSRDRETDIELRSCIVEKKADYRDISTKIEKCFRSPSDRDSGEDAKPQPKM